MSSERPLDQLAALIRRAKSSILTRWGQQVRELPSARSLDTPALNDHIPGLLDELADALAAKDGGTIPEKFSEDSPPAHGLQRLQEAFDIEEVVAEYNILRGCIHDLAENHHLDIRGRPFHIINRVLDHAIGRALQAYATQRALEVQQRREEYLAFVAHDLRTPLNAIALVANSLEMTQVRGASDASTASMLN